MTARGSLEQNENSLNRHRYLDNKSTPLSFRLEFATGTLQADYTLYLHEASHRKHHRLNIELLVGHSQVFPGGCSALNSCNYRLILDRQLSVHDQHRASFKIYGLDRTILSHHDINENLAPPPHLDTLHQLIPQRFPGFALVQRQISR